MKSNIKYISNIRIANRLVPTLAINHNSKTAVKTEKLFGTHSQSHQQNGDQQNQVRIQRVHSTKEKSAQPLQSYPVLQQKTNAQPQYQGCNRNSCQAERTLKNTRYSYDLKAGAQVNKFLESRLLKESKINYTNERSTPTKILIDQSKEVGAFADCSHEIDEVLKRKQKYGGLKKREEYRAIMDNRGKRNPQQQQTICTNVEQIKNVTVTTQRYSQQQLHLRIKKLELKVKSLQDQLSEKQKQYQECKQEKQKIDGQRKYNQSQVDRLSQALSVKTLQFQTNKLQRQSQQEYRAAQQKQINELSDKLANYQHKCNSLSGNYRQLLGIFGLENQQPQEDRHQVLIQTIKNLIDSYCELAEKGEQVNHKEISGQMDQQESMKDQDGQYMDRITELEEANRELNNVIESQIEKNYQLQDVLRVVSENLMRQKIISLNTQYKQTGEND